MKQNQQNQQNYDIVSLDSPSKAQEESMGGIPPAADLSQDSRDEYSQVFLSPEDRLEKIYTDAVRRKINIEGNARLEDNEKEALIYHLKKPPAKMVKGGTSVLYSIITGAVGGREDHMNLLKDIVAAAKENNERYNIKIVGPTLSPIDADKYIENETKKYIKSQDPSQDKGLGDKLLRRMSPPKIDNQEAYIQKVERLNLITKHIDGIKNGLDLTIGLDKESDTPSSTPISRGATSLESIDLVIGR